MSTLRIPTPLRPYTEGQSEVQVSVNNVAEAIAELLKRFEGNRRQTADLLGISERTLYRKLRKYALS